MNLSQDQSDRPDERDRSNCANASMVAAIASLPAALIVGLGVLVGLTAIILGILGLRSKKRNLAKFGIIVGAIGAAASVASIILWFVLWRASQ